jgi:hypothetical protein
MLTLLQSPRTVVVTTYSTLHTREITKSERKFIIQERRQDGNTPKRLKSDDGNSVPSGEGDEVEFDIAEFDSAESDDEDWMSPEEMLHCGMKKRLDRQKRVAKFPSINCPELRGKRLKFLAKDDDKIQPDGNLVEYKCDAR